MPDHSRSVVATESMIAARTRPRILHPGGGLGTTLELCVSEMEVEGVLGNISEVVVETSPAPVASTPAPTAPGGGTIQVRRAVGDEQLLASDPALTLPCFASTVWQEATFLQRHTPSHLLESTLSLSTRIHATHTSLHPLPLGSARHPRPLHLCGHLLRLYRLQGRETVRGSRPFMEYHRQITPSPLPTIASHGQHHAPCFPTSCGGI